VYQSCGLNTAEFYQCSIEKDQSTCIRAVVLILQSSINAVLKRTKARVSELWSKYCRVLHINDSTTL